MNFPEIKLKPEIWNKILDAGITDPDGWRHSLAQSWDTPTTLSEFVYRAINSSAMHSKKDTVFDLINRHAEKTEDSNPTAKRPSKEDIKRTIEQARDKIFQVREEAVKTPGTVDFRAEVLKALPILRDAEAMLATIDWDGDAGCGDQPGGPEKT